MQVKAFGYGLLVLVGLLALTWVFQGNDFFMFKVFAPAQEQVRRETFEQSKAYRQGVIQELDRAYQDYNAKDATQGQKDAIASVVLHRVADFDTEALPGYLKAFVEQLRRDRAAVR